MVWILNSAQLPLDADSWRVAARLLLTDQEGLEPGRVLPSKAIGSKQDRY